MGDAKSEQDEELKQKLADILTSMFKDGTIKISTAIVVENDNEVCANTKVVINNAVVYEEYSDSESVYPPSDR